jgi:hypothetical protein
MNAELSHADEQRLVNAAVHARTAMTLRFTLGATSLRIEVEDGSAMPAIATSADADAMSGRGLALVDGIATTWGVTETAAGKVVCFELAIDRGDAPT